MIHNESAAKSDVGECAAACDLAGEIWAANGDVAGAQGYWKKAAGLLAPYLKDSRDWRVLEESGPSVCQCPPIFP